MVLHHIVRVRRASWPSSNSYSALTSGQAFRKGKWPMLSLMVPCTQVEIGKTQIIITGTEEDEARRVVDCIQEIVSLPDSACQDIASPNTQIDLQSGEENYKARVARAIESMQQGKHTKVIPTRKVPLPFRVHMPATLLHGRRETHPHEPSPSTTWPGPNYWWQSNATADPSQNKLLDDPKEVHEHTIAIKGTLRRLATLCTPESIAVKDFMTPLQRGSVQHLFSLVCGRQKQGLDGWDALPGLIGNITVPGLPGDTNLEAIECFENEPRDLYYGAVVVVDDAAKLFEATSVLRTVFQDQSRQWLQAGAGITVHSTPEREFVETCEKLGTISPSIVAESVIAAEPRNIYLQQI
ncbi:ADC synthase [Aspergillus spectabilis]